ncbi:hypothetical protein Taro_037647 [Colocasia esculenta]|uniref:FAF domain-containing protein n=1 Tax=Colocasia esculenta TaxID=4460 RepID=A0A843WQC4_COLES|nr:hypothetical protein [Colocasia esculenta]
MMDLRKTVHNLLSLLDPDQGCQINTPRRGRHMSSASSSAGLRCVAGNIPSSTPHVVESAAVGSKPPCLPLPLPLPSLAEVGGVEEASRSGCLYGRSGGACLDLCTESLGFESCCDGRMGAEERQAEQEIRQRIEEYKRRQPSGEVDDDALQRRKGRSMTRRRRKTQAKEFPPPIPSLGVGGHSSSFLKAVKSDGRLVLTEVRVERPEILRASRRQDGRLTLELVKSEPADQVEEKESAEDGGVVAEEVAEVLEAAKTEEKDEVEEEERRRWWEAPGLLERRGKGGELGRGRCQEMVRSSLRPSPLWGARFVTTA